MYVYLLVFARKPVQLIRIFSLFPSDGEAYFTRIQFVLCVTHVIRLANFRVTVVPLF